MNRGAMILDFPVSTCVALFLGAAAVVGGAARADNTPSISFSPPLQDFGKQLANVYAKQTVAFKITNSGTAPLQISRIELHLTDDFDQFGIAGVYDKDGAPVASCGAIPCAQIVPMDFNTVIFNYRPTRRGHHSATVDIYSNDPNKMLETPAPALYGTGVTQPLVADPVALDFGTFRTGAGSPSPAPPVVPDGGATDIHPCSTTLLPNQRCLTLRNTVPIDVSFKLTITGQHPEHFQVADTFGNITGNMSYSTVVTFVAPMRAIGTSSAALVFNPGPNLQTTSIPVTAQTVDVILPLVTWTVPTFDFGMQPLGASPATHDFTVVNASIYPQTIGSLAIPDNSPFSVVPGPQLTTSLNPGEKESFTVAFAPTKLGPQESVLTLSVGNADAGDTVLTLKGLAVAPELEGRGCACTVGQRTDGAPAQALVASVMLLAALSIRLARRRLRS